MRCWASRVPVYASDEVVSAVVAADTRTLDVEVYVDVDSPSTTTARIVPAAVQSTMIHHQRTKARRYCVGVTSRLLSMAFCVAASFGRPNPRRLGRTRPPRAPGRGRGCCRDRGAGD